MKKILLHEEGGEHRYYKANLHCHTTCSDADKTPEEVKEDYRKHGYSVIAYTDHDIILDRNYLTDDTFLALNGIEIEVDEEREGYLWRQNRTCHLCLIAETPDNLKNVCYHRSKYLQRNAPKYRDVQVHDESEPDYERVWSHEGVNDMIRRAKQGGFFVTYNHPTWSEENFNDYTGYTGMDAMEIVNYSAQSIGYEEWNGRVYDEMLKSGKRIYCIAADDNHNHSADGDPASDSYGGYIWIDSPALTYSDIMASLKAGRFYAVGADTFTEGPKIREVSYEDGQVTVRADTAVTVNLICNERTNRRAMAKPGEVVSDVTFPVADTVEWFRIIVTDAKGHHAYTNAFYTADLK